jgi:hypothetical protein
MSIGSGAFGETEDLSLVWSIIMILCGSSFIGGAIGYFGAMAIESAEESSGSHKGEMEEPTKAEKSKASVLSCFYNMFINPSIQYYNDNRTFLNVYGLLFVWITIGTTYGVFYEGWSILRSVYYAVANLSTAGAQAPATNAEGELTAIQGWFGGFFSATGVPIFGLALGQLGGILVDRAIETKEKKAMGRLILKHEFDTVANLNPTGDDDGVDFTEFILLELIRLNRLSLGQLEHIREEFRLRDIHNNGEVSWQEIRNFQIKRAAKCLETIRLVSEGNSKKRAAEIANTTPIERMAVVTDPDAVKKVLATTVLAKPNEGTNFNAVKEKDNQEPESAFVVKRGKIRRKTEHLV